MRHSALQSGTKHGPDRPASTLSGQSLPQRFDTKSAVLPPIQGVPDGAIGLDTRIGFHKFVDSPAELFWYGYLQDYRSPPMIAKTSLLKPLALAALLASLLAAGGAAQATITIYTSLASFNAATTARGTDTFDGFLITGVTPSFITRFAGPYSYRATAPGNFFGAGTLANPALSVNNATDTISFDNFLGGPQAIGGNFFGTDIDGNFLLGSVTVTATDSSGTVTQTISGATVNSFLGFVSSTTMTAMTLAAVQAPGVVYPTLDNLVMARSVSVVPELETCALMLAGLGMVGLFSRRRRR
jgi:hypothetical protein